MKLLTETKSEEGEQVFRNDNMELQKQQRRF